MMGPIDGIIGFVDRKVGKCVARHAPEDVFERIKYNNQLYKLGHALDSAGTTAWTWNMAYCFAYFLDKFSDSITFATSFLGVYAASTLTFMIGGYLAEHTAALTETELAFVQQPSGLETKLQ